MKINKKKIGYGLFVFVTLSFILWAMLYQSGTVGGPKKVAPGEAKAPDVSVDWTELHPMRIPVVYRAGRHGA